MQYERIEYKNQLENFINSPNREICEACFLACIKGGPNMPTKCAINPLYSTVIIGKRWPCRIHIGSFYEEILSQCTRDDQNNETRSRQVGE